MKTCLSYGLGIALAVGVVTLIAHIAGYLTEPEKFGMGLIILGVTGVIASIVGVVLGVKEVRFARGPAGLSYGRAFTIAFGIGLVATLAVLAFNLVYFTYINPNYLETLVTWTRSRLEHLHLSDAAIDQAEANIRAKFSPLRQIVEGLVYGLVIKTVLALIVAAFMRRAATDPAEGPPIARI